MEGAPPCVLGLVIPGEVLSLAVLEVYGLYLFVVWEIKA